MRINSMHVQMAKCAMACFLGVGAIASYGATKYWDVDAASGLQGGNGVWDTGSTAMWSTSTAGSNPLDVWEDGDSAEFRATIGQISYTNTIPGSVNVNSINKGSNNRVVISGGTLRIGAGGIINDEGGETKALVIESQVELTADQEWRVKWTSPSIIRVMGNIVGMLPAEN